MKKNPKLNLDNLNGPLANLRAVAGDPMMQEALEIMRERLALTPEKLALMILRIVNPDEMIGQVEEAELRGVKPETLRNAKANGDFPRQINGVASA